MFYCWVACTYFLILNHEDNKNVQINVGFISIGTIINTNGWGKLQHDLSKSIWLLCRQSAADHNLWYINFIWVYVGFSETINHLPATFFFQAKHTKFSSIVEGSLKGRGHGFAVFAAFLNLLLLCLGRKTGEQKLSCWWWLDLCPTQLVALSLFFLSTGPNMGLLSVNSIFIAGKMHKHEHTSVSFPLIHS